MQIGLRLNPDDTAIAFALYLLLTLTHINQCRMCWKNQALGII
jgi:hypothetical protein